MAYSMMAPAMVLSSTGIARKPDDLSSKVFELVSKVETVGQTIVGNASPENTVSDCSGLDKMDDVRANLLKIKSQLKITEVQTAQVFDMDVFEASTAESISGDPGESEIWEDEVYEIGQRRRAWSDSAIEIERRCAARDSDFFSLDQHPMIYQAPSEALDDQCDDSRHSVSWNEQDDITIITTDRMTCKAFAGRSSGDDRYRFGEERHDAKSAVGEGGNSEQGRGNTAQLQFRWMWADTKGLGVSRHFARMDLLHIHWSYPYFPEQLREHIQTYTRRERPVLIQPVQGANLMEFANPSAVFEWIDMGCPDWNDGDAAVVL